MNMDKNKSIGISFNLQEYGREYGTLPHPRDIKAPENSIRSKWVPQTMFDSVWIFYEFDTKENKNKFLENKPDEFREARVLDFDQAYFNRWTKENEEC